MGNEQGSSLKALRCVSEHCQGARDLECMMALPVAYIHVLHAAISRNNSHRTVRVHTTIRHLVITEGQYSDERTYIVSKYLLGLLLG